MKKFIVLVIICVVVASLGLLTFNFLTTNESITVDPITLYVNDGDTFEINVIRTNPKESTKIDISYEGFESMVTYSPVNDNYEALEAGQVVFKVTSNLPGFAAQTVVVNIGNGTKNAPYYITSEEQLKQIGAEDSKFDVNANYVLVNDITLASESWTPLCSSVAFEGDFDFNGHTISNLKINNQEYKEFAGLFAKIGENGVIRNANLKNVEIQGNFKYAGCYAGKNAGTITKANVYGFTIANSSGYESFNGGIAGYSNGLIQRSQVAKNETLISSIISQNNCFVGALVGRLETTSSITSKVATISRCSATDVNLGGQVVGGLVGECIGAELTDVYFNGGNLSATSTNLTSLIGGLIGRNIYATIIENSVETTQPTALINSYVKNKIIVGENVTADAVIASNIQKYSSLTMSNLKNINIVWGTYYFENQETNVETNLEKSDFVKVEKISSVDNVIVETFKSSSNTGSVETITVAYFDRENVWNINEGEYPTLNYDGANSLSLLARVGATQLNKSNFVDEIKANPNGTFALESDIDFGNSLIEGIDTFTGTINGNGKTIKNASLNGSGLFKNIKTTANIYNLKLENIKVLGGENAAVLASVNEGTIGNCLISNCEVNSVDNNVATGVLVAQNKGNIYNVVLKNNKIIVSSVNEQESADDVRNVGTIAGINTNIIKDSLVYSTNKIIVANNVVSYVGGAVGYNTSTTLNSVSYVEVGYGYTGELGANQTEDDIALILGGLDFDKVYVGGLIGFNTGDVAFNKVSGKFKAANIGGLVGKNTVLSTELFVQQNEVSNLTDITAKYAGGLVFEANAGTIKNCATFASMEGVGADSKVAGYVVNIFANKKNNSIIDFCFAATVLTGEGNKYYESGTPELRESIFGWRPGDLDTARIENCVFDKELASDNGNRKVISLNESGFGRWIIENIGQGKEYALSTNEAKNPTNAYYSKYDKETVWNFEAGMYPQLKQVNSTLASKINKLVELYK